MTGWILCTQIAFTDGVYPYTVSQNPAGPVNVSAASNTSRHEAMLRCSGAAVWDSFEVDFFGHLVFVVHQLRLFSDMGHHVIKLSPQQLYV